MKQAEIVRARGWGDHRGKRVAVSFLLWLLYVHHASADSRALDVFAGPQRASERIVRDCALRGIIFHQASQKEAHRNSMLLLCVLFHFSRQLHREPRAARRHDFSGHGQVRTLYLSILASHVILSIVALPMVLTTFFFLLTGRFAMHRRIGALDVPIWLYVSITGVVVFVFLKRTRTSSFFDSG